MARLITKFRLYWPLTKSLQTGLLLATGLAGRSKYALKKMFELASETVFSFSLAPVRIILGFGVVFLVLAALGICNVLSFWVREAQASLEPGSSSLIFVILFVGGMLMVSLGNIGVYISYIFQEVNNRPVYLVRSVHGEIPHDQ